MHWDWRGLPSGTVRLVSSTFPMRSSNSSVELLMLDLRGCVGGVLTGVDESLDFIISEIKKNKENMITWDVLQEGAPPEAGMEAPGGAPEAVAPEAPIGGEGSPEMEGGEGMPETDEAIPEE